MLSLCHCLPRDQLIVVVYIEKSSKMAQLLTHGNIFAGGSLKKQDRTLWEARDSREEPAHNEAELCFANVFSTGPIRVTLLPLPVRQSRYPRSSGRRDQGRASTAVSPDVHRRPFSSGLESYPSAVDSIGLLSSFRLTPPKDFLAEYKDDLILA
jgi:hypothetical protein